MIIDKITLLNQTVLDSFRETDELRIIKNFTDAGVKVLGADFGLVWLNSYSSKNLELVYKSPSLPFIPKFPRPDGRNFRVLKTGKPDFIKDIDKTPDARYLHGSIKSFVIIPISYKEQVYGNIVLCFKQKELFPKEKK